MLSLIVCPEAKLFPLRCWKQRSPPSPPGLWFISCFLSEAPFMSLFSTRRGIRSLTATSTVAVSDVLSWNRSSFPPTESRSEAVNLTKRDWRGWARQVLSFPLVCEVDDLLGFPVIFYNTINNHLLCALDKLSSGVFKDCFFNIGSLVVKLKKYPMSCRVDTSGCCLCYMLIYNNYNNIN